MDQIQINNIIIFVANNKQMKTYMTKYLVTYWTERNDESTDVELIIYAYNEIDAQRKFYDMNIVHKKIESVKELV